MIATISGASWLSRLGLLTLINRLGKFGVVGASGATINMVIFGLLTAQAHLHYLVASVLAIEIALFSNYVLNNNWTFADRRSGLLSWSGAVRYQVVSIGGTLINLGVLHGLAGALAMPPMFANVVGIGLAACWNFSMSLHWAWRAAAVRIESQPT